MSLIVYVENDNRVLLTGLQNQSSGSYENSATVSGQITDAAGTNVGTAITFNYISASNGNYEGTIEDGVALSANTRYTLTVTADAGSDKIGKWVIPLIARVRAV